MAFVDRNSKHVLNRLLMFLTDLYVLLRGTDKASLRESIRAVTRKHP
jgi:hypothetical protein